MYEPQNNNMLYQQEQQQAQQARVATYMAKVMGWMCLGLFTTVVFGFLCLRSQQLFYFVYGSQFRFYGLLIAEVAVAMVFSYNIKRMNSAICTTLFMFYSMLTGLTLASIVLVFELHSIMQAFVIAATMFLAMSLFGILTKADMSKYRNLFMFGLLGLIGSAVINIFIYNSMLDFAICCFGVVLFTGLTAYDTQKIKDLYLDAVYVGMDEESEDVRKLAIFGAFNLYLDFINLFLYLLRLLGSRRSN